MNKNITITDVAAKANVSKKTVSRVINNEHGVSEKTRNKVQATISELNYSPDPQARGLASKRSFLLALIYDNPNAEFVTEAMYGVLNTCQGRGYELVVHPCVDHNVIDIDSILAFVRRIKVDGVVLLPPLSEFQPLVDALKSHSINYVRMLSTDNELTEHLVQFDDESATKDVVSHLIEQGHTRIGFIKGAANSQSAERRYTAFCEAIKQQGISLPEHFIQQGNYTFQSGIDCGEKLLAQTPLPTAIFASNDEMAMGVIGAANKKNLRIPQDIALVGFDDSPHSSEIIPSLTTVNLQIRKVASLAAEKLLLLCEDKSKEAAELPYRITSELIIRDSTAAE